MCVMLVRNNNQPVTINPKLDHIKAMCVTIYIGYRWKSESIKKPNWLLEGKDEFWVSVNKKKNYSKLTPGLSKNLN